MGREITGREEGMEHEEELPSSSSLDYLTQCRICHEEEDERRATMESPCGCCGSLKYAHRECVQRWCDEKGSTLCEICLQNFKPGYTMPPKKTPVVETAVTISEDMQSVESPESLIDGADYNSCSYSADRGAMWCRSLTITFTMMLLVWHLVAVVTVEAADHCAFSLLTMYLLRAAGILLPFYVVMRLIRMVQRGQQQYRLQMLQDQRRNGSTMNHMHGQEEEQLVISIH
ncbi:E3 ubiquitin-protein ligase MARCHF5-like [Panicum virgatum]|uniref:RING-CH-type domain-containing protein n=1 Tax=Panicum virgatum TaxID=38727 RepID=A0A8T0UZN4_PANVG|nr:E3 ubiquitin-protein ligase MARCHF5-like [Panicum virgatum]KAG2628260.1 hypothetical protein PVAP13_3KG504200 [Panicum virgatum]